MSYKFIIDGAPGSGKTTLLFGNKDKNISCLNDYDIIIIEESITEVANIMRKEGKIPTDLLKEFVTRTIDKSIEHSSQNFDKNCILERGLPGYFFIEETFNTELPEKYFDFCKNTEYASPIFVLEPIYEFDMSKPNKALRKGRVATLEQRINMFNKTVTIYQELGYLVEIVPRYSDDLKESNQKRIEHILNFINKV